MSTLVLIIFQIFTKSKAPDNQINFGSIKGYYIGYRVSDSSEVFIYKTLETNGDKSGKSETLLKNLNKSTKYDVVVQAFNSKGIEFV